MGRLKALWSPVEHHMWPWPQEVELAWKSPRGQRGEEGEMGLISVVLED